MITREQWLMKLAKRMEMLLFKPAGARFDKYRITCGWPSTRALSAKNRRIGECWVGAASEDGAREIVISMAVDNEMEVAQILAHEMVHASAGMPAGHGKEFRKLALAIGLEGKMTATTAGQKFKDIMGPALLKLGAYPHAKLNGQLSGRKKQGTRMIKLVCREDSGYTVRMTRTWITTLGAAVCPCHLSSMIEVE